MDNSISNSTSKPRIALVGEAWGEREEIEGAPFVGPTGKFLNHCLHIVGINRNEALVTNVFNLRPHGNDIKNFCGPKLTAIPGRPPLVKGKFVRKEFASELDRLERELRDFNPTVVVAMGATAAWALLGTAGIKKVRGAPARGFNGFKVIPTYHPTAILRQYTLFPVLIADLEKALRESYFPEVRRPQRFIHIEPTYDDLLSFERQYIATSPDLSIDIETAGNQITCFGIAPSVDRALVVPITDETKGDKCYWPDTYTEVKVWEWIAHICSLPKARIVGQNFNYDMKFTFQSYGIPIPYANHDIMLLHHAMQPEMEKSLGFMGSIYTNELAWKFMRPKHQTVKKED